jgi:predicted TIM-barrel fold metal-dependent hydrolase
VDDRYYGDMMTIISAIQPRIVMIHTGWGSRVEPLEEVINHFSKIKFILVHMKEDDDSYNAERIHAMSACDNSLVETSYAPHPKRISQYVRMGFGKRMLFGTDFRVLSDEQTLRYYKHLITEADISNHAKKDILYDNACNLLHEIDDVEK